MKRSLWNELLFIVEYGKKHNNVRTRISLKKQGRVNTSKPAHILWHHIIFSVNPIQIFSRKHNKHLGSTIYTIAICRWRIASWWIIKWEFKLIRTSHTLLTNLSCKFLRFLFVKWILLQLSTVYKLGFNFPIEKSLRHIIQSLKHRFQVLCSMTLVDSAYSFTSSRGYG